MSIFKVGDKVRRLRQYQNRFGWDSKCSANGLKADCILTVTGTTNDYVSFKLNGANDSRCDYTFELVNDESYFKVGDEVLCICANDMEYIIKGKTYKISKITNNNHMEVITKGGRIEHAYHQKRFKHIGEVLKIGDMVRIINQGQYYCSHCEMAKKMNLSNWEKNREGLITDSISIIVAINGIHIGINCDGKDYIYGDYGLELITPKEELIETKMEHVNIDEIKNFPLDVLVKAEKKAKEELAEEQSDIAVTKFKELHKQIAIAKSNVKQAQDILKDLRGKVRVAKPVKVSKPKAKQ